MLKKKHLLLFFALSISLAFISGCNSSSRNKISGGPPTVLLDQKKMIDPGHKSVRGKKIWIKEYKGKPLILNFWATWCPPCKAESPTFQKVYNYYKNKNVNLLMIAINDTDENVVRYMNNEHLDFPVALDSNGALSTYYGVSGVPTTIFVNSKGEILRRFVGQLNEQQLASYIDEITK